MIILSKNYSQNKKLGGGVFATYRKVGGGGPDGGTCPSTCSHLAAGSCYAMFGNVARLAKRSDAEEPDGEALMAWMGALPRNALIRHHVSGDVCLDGVIDRSYVRSMNHAHIENPSIKGWGYTHAWRELNPLDFSANGLTINASCDNAEDLDDALEAGWKAVVTVGETQEASWRVVTPGGRSIVVVKCPADYDAGVSCSNCQLCIKRRPDRVIAFEVHGAGRKRVELDPRVSNGGD